MIQFRLFSKKMMMALAVVFCSVMTANAATITYKLTTHVDGRTIEATTQVESGDLLLDNMPQALWRGYTTYTFSTVEGEAITTAPDEDATVIVDYVFNPPFILSQEGGEPVWQYIRGFDGANSTNRIVYFRENDYNYYPINVSTRGRLNAATRNDFGRWAFYGDGYSLNVRNYDGKNVADEDYVNQGTRTDTYGSRYAIFGAPLAKGLQLYLNTVQNKTFQSGFFTLANPDGDRLLYSDNVSTAMAFISTSTASSNDYVQLNEKNELVYRNGYDYHKTLNWYALFVYPADDATIDPAKIWHVTYNVKTVDGFWVSKEQNKTKDLTPSLPASLQRDGYTYDGPYLDADFTIPFVGSLSEEGNEVLYYKEVKALGNEITREFTVGRWATLVTAYDIPDLTDIEGGFEVEALEYVDLNVEREDYWSKAHLFFETTNEIKAGYPYLFRITKAPVADGEKVAFKVANEGQQLPQLVTVSHEDDYIQVDMDGTFTGKTLDVAPYSEPKGYQYIYFYFGYDPDADPNYNFYVVDNGTVTINPYLCYFTVTYTGPKDEGPQGVRLFVNQNVTGISQVKAENVATDGKVYNLNGQQVSGNLSKGLYIVNGKKVLVK